MSDPNHPADKPLNAQELVGRIKAGEDVTINQEQVVEGETGLLVPMGDAAALRVAIARLSGDPDLRRRMGEAGRDRAVHLFDETKAVASALDALGL